MRSFRLEEIDAQALDDFNARHPQGNFQQSSRMAEVRRANGVDVSLLGVFEGSELVATCALEVHHAGLSTFAQVHDGPLCDFHDTELTGYLFSELARRARAAGAAQLEITPEAPYQVRDSGGRPLPDPASGEAWPAGVPAGAPTSPDAAAFDAIVACGFQHEGFDRTYNAVPRWRYVKDLTGIEDERGLLGSYAKNTRRNVGIARESFVRVENVGRDRLPEYHRICQLSCEKNGFENRPLAYFETLFDHLGGDVEVKIASIDARAYLDEWERKLAALDADIARFEAHLAERGGSPKVERRLADAREKRGGAVRRVEEARGCLEEGGGDVFPVAAAMFVWHPRECVYLFSGSDPRFARFCAPTAIQHQLMCECLERGVTRYNFYGIDGVFDDPDDPGHGLLQFKQGFGGYVEEMMGSFTLPVRPVVYAAKRLVHGILGR